jgi:autotransporter passenger strand-loop-strand repeat protein
VRQLGETEYDVVDAITLDRVDARAQCQLPAAIDAGTAANTILSGGTQVVFTSAANTTAGNGSIQQIVIGATASGNTLSSGSIQYDGGVASNTTLSGGTQTVFGSVATTMIDSGGTQSIAAGGTASGTTVSSFGIR